MADRIGMYIAALLFGAGLGVYGCWVSEYNDNIQDRGNCMVRMEREQGATPQDAWEMCR
jgi:hypothetical protein